MSFLSFLWSEWTILISLLIYLFYKWSTATYDFFNKKNVPNQKPVPLLGNFATMFLQRESFYQLSKRFYTYFNGEKLYGIYVFRDPHFVIRDPDIIKQITVKDFDHFVNHRNSVEEQDEPLFANSLFFLKDQKWRDMRSTLSPAFTGSKMRLMFQLVEETCRTTVENLKIMTKKGQLDLELKDFFTRYTNDIIATTAFGLKIDSLKDKDNQFYRIGRAVSNFTGWFCIKFFLFGSFKKVMRLFNMRLFDKEHTKYFHDLVIDTMKYRNEHNIVRPDMINLLIEARKGNLKLSIDNHEDANGLTTFAEKSVGKSHNREWTDTEIVAQCFIFFLAGFETTSGLLCCCVHEIMENPDIQEKLLMEIDEVKKELNEKPLTYEILNKIKYLDMVVSETLRKWPPLSGVDRVCVKPYTIVDHVKGSNIHINKGDLLIIPVFGIHTDPKYYPEPEKFDPERFNDENKGKINPFTFIPFGLGPRVCIGSRLALMETKAIIFHLLSEFKFEVSEKSTIPLQLCSYGVSLRAKNGFWINFKPRN